MSLWEFLAELRHRGVLKVATAYRAGGLVPLEAGTQLLHAFEAPRDALKVFTTFLIQSFPIACLAAGNVQVARDTHAPSNRHRSQAQLSRLETDPAGDWSGRMAAV